MEFTNEQRAKAAKSAEELSDNELDNVSGGCGGKKDPEPKYRTGQILWVGYPSTQNFLRVEIKWPEFYVKGDGWRYYCTNEYGIDENYYLETHKYIMTKDPGKTWPFK